LQIYVPPRVRHSRECSEGIARGDEDACRWLIEAACPRCHRRKMWGDAQACAMKKLIRDIRNRAAADRLLSEPTRDVIEIIRPLPESFIAKKCSRDSGFRSENEGKKEKGGKKDAASVAEREEKGEETARGGSG